MRRHVLATALVTGLFAVHFSNAQTPTAGHTQTPARIPAFSSCQELAATPRPVIRNNARLEDWASFERYRGANRAIASSGSVDAVDTVDVVFVGDSIIDAWQQPNFGGFFPGEHYVNRAISSQATPQMLVRFRADVIALHPKAVVILAGANDICGSLGPESDEEIEGYLASMSELAAANDIKVVLSSLTPVSDYHVASPSGVPQTMQRPMARIRAVNAWMRVYAVAHRAVYLDYFSAMVDGRGVLKEEFSADDLHPTAAGYAIMAPLAEAAIAKALGR